MGVLLTEQEAIKFWDLVLIIDPLNPHALKSRVDALKKIGGEYWLLNFSNDFLADPEGSGRKNFRKWTQYNWEPGSAGLGPHM